jgi:hypothetical protein
VVDRVEGARVSLGRKWCLYNMCTVKEICNGQVSFACRVSSCGQGGQSPVLDGDADALAPLRLHTASSPCRIVSHMSMITEPHGATGLSKFSSTTNWWERRTAELTLQRELHDDIKKAPSKQLV